MRLALVPKRRLGSSDAATSHADRRSDPRGVRRRRPGYLLRVPFDVPEYERAFLTFFGEAIHEVAAVRDPLIAEIPFEQSPGAMGSVIQDQEGNDVELVSDPISTKIEITRNDVLAGDVEPLLLLIDSASEDLSAGLAKNLFASLSTVTEATGNVVDAKGKSVYDAMIEMMETIELTLDDDDELSLPSAWMNPKTMENLPPPTPEQEARMEELKKERLAELLARRRSRRLY